MNKNIKRTIIITVLLGVSVGIIFITGRYNFQDKPKPVSHEGSYDTGRVYAKPAVTYAPAGHIVCMLGKGNSLRAISGGMLRDKLLLQHFPHIADLPVIKGGGSINYEEMMKSGADIVIISPDLASDERAIKKIKVTGIDYAVFAFNTMEDQIQAVRKIGKILNSNAIAAKYETFYRNIIRLVSRRLETIPLKKRKKIYFSVLEVNRTHAKHTMGADWIKAAGLVNYTGDNNTQTSGDKFYISVEGIIAWDPDIIFVNESEAEQTFMTSDKFSSLKAVKNKGIIKMPNGISRWGHSTSFETPLAILFTAKKAYPEKFRDIKMKKYARQFYQNFFNIKLDTKSLQKILSGRGMRHGKHNRKH